MISKARIPGMVAAGLMACTTTGAVATAPQRPKLIVVVSVDQLSASLFDQYRARFTSGLRRMADEGVVFPNGYQSHAATETCPGHSTLLTGQRPAATGIIANSWYDRATGTNLYCVQDSAHPVPGREGRGRGPANLKVSTLGEWLKKANPKSRVFGVSGKDRAAIMMTGHDPDGVFWWDDERGFNTSVPAGTEEAARLAPVAGFNAALFDKWSKAPPVWRPASQRCAALDGPHRYGKLAMDHHAPPPGWTATAGSDFTKDSYLKKWFRASPEMDGITLDLAENLMDRFQLGQGAAPDLLAVSLSATDYIGHRYGNQGPEMCDQMAQLDARLGRFLDKIAALRLPVMVVLSADHGAVDAAERVSERAVPALRIDPDRILDEVRRAVKAELRLDHDPLAGDGQQIYVSTWGDDETQRQRITDAAIRLLRQRPEVERVFTAAEIAAVRPRPGEPADEKPLAERLAESFDSARSGDILVVYKPYSSHGEPENPGDSVAGHGSPWNYDRRVPILFWWPGADGFEQSLPVETIDIGPTLARLSGVETPPVEGRCLDLDRGAGDSCAVADR